MLALVAQTLPPIEQIPEYDKKVTRLFELHSDVPNLRELAGSGSIATKRHFPQDPTSC